MLPTANITAHTNLTVASGTRTFMAGLLLMVCSFIYPSNAVADDKAKYDLRAAYIYNFFIYINWPPHIENAPLKNIVICINANDEVFENFNNSLLKKSSKGKKLLTRRIRGAEDIPGCWIIYNSPSAELVHIPDDINTAGQGYLTIGENPNATQETDIIRFYEQSNKLRFEISPSAAKTAGFTISSNLLRLAKIIRPASADKAQETSP